jgi:DNA polymerase-3 subunit alpha
MTNPFRPQGRLDSLRSPGLVFGEGVSLLLYQEQIMLVLNQLGGIALEDGYEFVKQAAKRKDVEAFRERFLTSSVNSTMSKDEGETLFGELAEAACYAVCKSHQLAIAVTTWQSAYLKTHYRRKFEQATEAIAVGSN